MAVKTLDTLIKLHKHRVDLLRRELALINEQIQQLEQVLAKLAEDVSREMEMVTLNPDYAVFFAGYVRYVKDRQQKIAEEIARLQHQADEKRSQIAEEFTEQKKFEIARTSQLKKILALENTRNQQQLDEIAMQQFNILTSPQES